MPSSEKFPFALPELSDIILFGSCTHPRPLGTRNIKLTDKIYPIWTPDITAEVKKKQKKTTTPSRVD
jgi:hypothetical protein